MPLSRIMYPHIGETGILRHKRGFTLAELLIVVVILVVLAAIAVPVMLGQKRKAENARAQTNAATAGQVLFTAAGTGGTATYNPTTRLIGVTYNTGGGGRFSVAASTPSEDETFLMPPTGQVWSTGAQITIATPELDRTINLTDWCVQDTGADTYSVNSKDYATATTPVQETCAATPDPTPSPTPSPTIAAVSLFMVGNNGYGQFGNGTASSSLTPVTITATGALAGKTIKLLTVGYAHTCAATTDNTIACWGWNMEGQLGDTTVLDRTLPVTTDTTGVLAGKTFTRIVAGEGHTCATTADNMVACWGRNTDGQLGDGTNTQRRIPVTTDTTGVLAGKTITELALGLGHTCAVAADGTAACWGKNGVGQLGDGTTTPRNRPVSVRTTGALTGKKITHIAVGNYYTCATTEDGIVVCWGLNSDGQLGDGTNNNTVIPVRATGVTDATAVTAGQSHTCAISAGNTIKCWGTNTSGQIGDGTTANRNTPTATVASGALNGITVTSITAGGNHTCVYDTVKHVICWGRNVAGQLGDGTTTNRTEPVVFAVPALPAGADSPQVLTGGFYTGLFSQTWQ